MRDHRKIRVWQTSHRHTLDVYRATTGFPSTEQFGLVSQLRRSSASIGSNIVEGAARSSRREFARFLDIAIGSAAECGYQLLLAHELGCLDAATYAALGETNDHIRRQLSRLRDRVRREA